MSIFAGALFRRGRKISRAEISAEGLGTVRMHLAQPKSGRFKKQPSACAVAINGRRMFSAEHRQGALIGAFIAEAEKYGGKRMSGEDMRNAILLAAADTRRLYRNTTEAGLAPELGKALSVLFGGSRAKEAKSGIKPLSVREYAAVADAPLEMELLMETAPGEKAAVTLKKIIDKCDKAGIARLTFIGGAAFREELAVLIGHARRFATELDADGIPLDPKLCAELKTAGLSGLRLTLYSHSPVIHNRLSAENDWETATGSIKSAIAAGLGLTVRTPLSARNADYDKTLEFLKELGVTRVECSAAAIAGGNGNTGASENASNLSLEVKLKKEIIAGVLASTAIYCKLNGMELSFTSPGAVDTELFERLELETPVCGACTSVMAVGPDGSVYPCGNRRDEKPLGNLLRGSWKKIWNSPACKRIREESAENTGA